MEKYLQLETSDNHIIYGTLNFFEKPKNKLIIFVHGLSGNQYEHHYYNAPKYFCPKGYDTFKFDLYSGKNKARQLSECTISIHAQDLNIVINHFKDIYDELYLIGHSLGALTIMNADTSNISKIIQWDPACGLNLEEKKEVIYDEKTGFYIVHRGIEFYLNKKMIEERKEVYNKKEYSKKVTKNTKFIFEGKANAHKLWGPHISKYESYIVKGASHVFIEEGTEEILFNQTLKFLES